jgi:phytoene dehydrogenase-like protein
MLAGFAFRKPFTDLKEGDGREILRILPMSASDFVGEYIQNDEHLLALLAWRGAIYNAVGPMSPGTAATMLFDGITGDGADGGAAGQTVVAIGGPGALATALADAARGFGAEVRTGAKVVAITEQDGRVTGVALASGEEIAAPYVLSTLDPKTTLLSLLGVESTGPDLRRRLRATRSTGVTSKLNLLVDKLPTFTAAGKGESAQEKLRGRIVILESILGIEKAFDASKYGRISETPIIEALIPTLIARAGRSAHCQLRGSVRTGGPQGWRVGRDHTQVVRGQRRGPVGARCPWHHESHQRAPTDYACGFAERLGRDGWSRDARQRRI